MARLSWIPLVLLLSSFLPAAASQYIAYTNSENEVLYLDDDRRPSLYTGNFGYCRTPESSKVQVDRFDASLYRDNMTVVFHISGSTSSIKDSVMLYIGVYAYGQTRFELLWNPCGTAPMGLCPIEKGTLITASGFIPLGASDLASIPEIAYQIPDFEGQAILRIFSNSTKSEIACVAAVVSNGATFRQVSAVGTVLGIFTVIAIVSSLATTMHGQDIVGMRRHYAHSFSVLVLFAVFHHIFFTGALSMNWPSVLPAFWSNYAWAAGMIHTSSMQRSISRLIAPLSRDPLAVGAEPSTAGGFDIARLYKRNRDDFNLPHSMSWSSTSSDLVKRAAVNASTPSRWFGNAVANGLPLPGNFSGFSGTLSQESIPASNAFLTGLIWLLICLLILAGSLIIFKFLLELMCRFKLIKMERLSLFRRKWKPYVLTLLARSLYIAWFPIMLLSTFQFRHGGPASMIAIAAIVFLLLLSIDCGLVASACYARLRRGTWVSQPDQLVSRKDKLTGFLPAVKLACTSKLEAGESASGLSLPWWKLDRIEHESEVEVHEDEAYILKHGWLASRFRQNRWWFFAFWLVYEFIRACFYGAASGHALTQACGLLVVELIAFVFMIKLRPFEGQRLNVMIIYLLGTSKIITVGLSIALATRFNLPRISATIIGIVIIIVQGFLTIALLICVLLGAVSTYFSLTRDRTEIRPRRLMPHRTRYLAYLARRGLQSDQIDATETPSSEKTLSNPGPYFLVNDVRRVAKIEDEDADFQRDITRDPRVYSDASEETLANVYDEAPSGSGEVKSARRYSVAHSVKSNVSRSSLPLNAKLHRGSWSTRDFKDQEGTDRLSRGGLAAPSSDGGIVQDKK